MNELQIFENKQFGQVRIVEMNGKPFFVANDVAKTLGYVETAKAIRTHCKGVSEMDIPTNGGIQSMKVIPEGDVYRLIVRSKLPKAEEFERWVFDEVLPTIRETGGYNLPKTYSEALRALADKAEENEKLKIDNERMKPKEEFFDTVTDSTDAIEMKDVANVLNFPGIGRNKLFKLLREWRILTPNNRPYQEYIDRGYFRTIEQTYDKGYGESGVNIKTVVYQKGVDFIRRQLNKRFGDGQYSLPM